MFWRHSLIKSEKICELALQGSPRRLSNLKCFGRIFVRFVNIILFVMEKGFYFNTAKEFFTVFGVHFCVVYGVQNEKKCRYSLFIFTKTFVLLKVETNCYLQSLFAHDFCLLLWTANYWLVILGDRYTTYLSHHDLYARVTCAGFAHFAVVPHKSQVRVNFYGYRIAFMDFSIVIIEWRRLCGCICSWNTYGTANYPGQLQNQLRVSCELELEEGLMSAVDGKFWSLSILALKVNVILSSDHASNSTWNVLIYM